MKPRVLVVGTGGTISYPGRTPLDLYEYADFAKPMEADDVVAQVPLLAGVADVVPVRFRALSSTGIAPADWLDLNETLHRLAIEHAPVAGIVVTHGTASVEETSYFLNLTLKIEEPVVCVGAQRPMGGLSSDGPLNLLNAVRLAASSQARGLGVLVMLNDEIHAAREVTKGSNLRLEAFRSHDLGMLGYVDPDDRIAIYRRPARKHTRDTPFDVRGLKTLPRVDIAYSYAGSDGAAIDAFVAAGAKAIVSAGFGPGKSTPAETAALERAHAAGVVAIQGSRTGSGRVLLRAPLREAGILVADNLLPQKARVLAMVGLTATEGASRLQEFFDTY